MKNPDPINDGVALQLSLHPRGKWYQRLWWMIKYSFVRPKFSKEALEPAEELEISNKGLNLWSHMN